MTVYPSPLLFVLSGTPSSIERCYHLKSVSVPLSLWQSSTNRTPTSTLITKARVNAPRMDAMNEKANCHWWPGSCLSKTNDVFLRLAYGNNHQCSGHVLLRKICCCAGGLRKYERRIAVVADTAWPGLGVFIASSVWSSDRKQFFKATDPMT